MWKKLWGYTANMSPEKQEGEVQYVSYLDLFGYSMHIYRLLDRGSEHTT